MISSWEFVDFSRARMIALVRVGVSLRFRLDGLQVSTSCDVTAENAKEKTLRTARPCPARPGVHNELRIVGGEWRGRRLKFAPSATAIRPTPDRVRETLFNWLQPVVRGARCLDLFAGSGALGIEALSRGARAVVFVEEDARAIRQIRVALEGFASRRP